MSEDVKKPKRVRVYEAILKGVDKAAGEDLKVLIVGRCLSDAKKCASFHVEKLKDIQLGPFWEVGTVKEVKSDAVVFAPFSI